MTNFIVVQTLQAQTNPSQPLLAKPNQFLLGKTGVHIWRVSLEQPAENVERFRELLSRDEQGRADRFRFEIDRTHFVVARGCLRTLLAQYLKTVPQEIKFSYSDYGKPQLADLETNLRFNLSHSGGLALYAFTRIGEVGVDIERIRPDFADEKIARRFFSVSEVACLARLPAQARVEAFFNCWTRKEAFIKAKGMGLSLPLDQFDVTLEPSKPAALLRTKWGEDEAASWSIEAIEVGQGYVAAVAVKSRSWQLSCWQLDEKA
ncbi:MAG: 4'-phosphopantetheinyl transferase superfamily protein [Acidobacteriota bacterium]